MTDRKAHTPGPWEYADFGLIVGPGPEGIHADIYIAEISTEDDEGRVAPAEQLTANANLIAAAPELLEALERVLEAVEYYHAHEGAPSMLAAVRTTIAKAQGQFMD